MSGGYAQWAVRYVGVMAAAAPVAASWRWTWQRSGLRRHIRTAQR